MQTMCKRITAKSVDNGEWLYGDLHYNSTGQPYLFVHDNVNDIMTPYKVDPETIKEIDTKDDRKTITGL